MSARPHDGTAEEGLSSSLVPLVHDTRRVEHLREVLSGFCHQCRNSLNGIKLSLYLFRRESRGTVPHCFGEIEGMYQQVEQFFDRLQAVYRPMAVQMLEGSIDELIRTHGPRWRSWYESRGQALRLEPPGLAVLGDFDPNLLGQGLDAIAAWRAEVAAASTLSRVVWGLCDDGIEILWHEEARPGPPDLIEHAGGLIRRDPGTSVARVDLLAIPLLARIIASHGGTLEYHRGESFSVRIRWPRRSQLKEHGLA